MTLTTHNDELSKKIEPHVCTSKERFYVLKKMHEAGIPTVVWLSPILPFINDTYDNISGILDYCIEANVKGVICFGMGLTLREGNREYFYNQLDLLFPGMKEKYIKTFGNQYIVSSPDNIKLMKFFHNKCELNGILHNNEKIFNFIHQFDTKQNCSQITFDEIITLFYATF